MKVAQHRKILDVIVKRYNLVSETPAHENTQVYNLGTAKLIYSHRPPNSASYCWGFQLNGECDGIREAYGETWQSAARKILFHHPNEVSTRALLSSSNEIEREADERFGAFIDEVAVLITVFGGTCERASAKGYRYTSDMIEVTRFPLGWRLARLNSAFDEAAREEVCWCHYPSLQALLTELTKWVKQQMEEEQKTLSTLEKLVSSE